MIKLFFNENESPLLELEITDSETMGELTGSPYQDYYVYQWYIKETGEIFYVGKGRGDRYKAFHARAYDAERIREKFDTGIHFVAKDLSEEDAYTIEANVMTQILNDKSDILTNRITPLQAKRGNYYGRSRTTPPFEFEKAPTLFACEIDEHFFGIIGRSFDKVTLAGLSGVHFVLSSLDRKTLDILYGGVYEKYVIETVNLLHQNGCKISKTRFSKQVASYIYIGDDYVTNFESACSTHLNKMGTTPFAFHLLDVRKFLTSELPYVQTKITGSTTLNISPSHNRVSLDYILDEDDLDTHPDGYDYWVLGEQDRKRGDLRNAILRFDQARYFGYLAPVLYESYAKVYRKLRDLDNEIDVLIEGTKRLRASESNFNVGTILNLDFQLIEAQNKFRSLKNEDCDRY